MGYKQKTLLATLSETCWGFNKLNIGKFRPCRFGPQSDPNPGNWFHQYLNLYKYVLWRLLFAKMSMGDTSATRCLFFSCKESHSMGIIWPSFFKDFNVSNRSPRIFQSPRELSLREKTVTLALRLDVFSGCEQKACFRLCCFTIQLLLPTKTHNNTSHTYNKETTHSLHLFVMNHPSWTSICKHIISQMGSLEYIDWNKDGSRRYSNETHDLNLPQKQVANVARTSQVSIWRYALDPPNKITKQPVPLCLARISTKTTYWCQKQSWHDEKNCLPQKNRYLDPTNIPSKPPFTSGGIYLED